MTAPSPRSLAQVQWLSSGRALSGKGDVPRHGREGVGSFLENNWNHSLLCSVTLCSQLPAPRRAVTLTPAVQCSRGSPITSNSCTPLGGYHPGAVRAGCSAWGGEPGTPRSPQGLRQGTAGLTTAARHSQESQTARQGHGDETGPKSSTAVCLWIWGRVWVRGQAQAGLWCSCSLAPARAEDMALSLNAVPRRSGGSPSETSASFVSESSVQGQAGAYQCWPRVQAAQFHGVEVNAVRALTVTLNPAVTDAGRTLRNGGCD